MLTRVPLCCLGRAMVVLFRACNCLLRRADPLPHRLSHLSLPSQQLGAQTLANAGGSWNSFRGWSQNMVMNQNENRTDEWNSLETLNCCLDCRTRWVSFSVPREDQSVLPQWRSNSFLRLWFSNLNLPHGNLSKMQISELHPQKSWFSESGEKPRELHVWQAPRDSDAGGLELHPMKHCCRVLSKQKSSTFLGISETSHNFSLVLFPWVWGLTRRTVLENKTNCISQKKTRAKCEPLLPFLNSFHPRFLTGASDELLLQIRGSSANQDCMWEYVCSHSSPIGSGWIWKWVSYPSSRSNSQGQPWGRHRPLCHLGLSTSTLWAQALLPPPTTISHIPYCLPHTPKLLWILSPGLDNTLLIVVCHPPTYSAGLYLPYETSCGQWIVGRMYMGYFLDRAFNNWHKTLPKLSFLSGRVTSNIWNGDCSISRSLWMTMTAEPLADLQCLDSVSKKQT